MTSPTPVTLGDRALQKDKLLAEVVPHAKALNLDKSA
jgi:hypothetical protein